MPPLYPVPHSTPDPEATTTPPAIVAEQPIGSVPPPLPMVRRAAIAPLPRAVTPPPSLWVSKGRHLVVGGVSLSWLGIGSTAYAMDSNGAALETMAYGGAATLAMQAIMGLIGYLRDYGKERLDAANLRAEKAETRVAELEAEVRRREEREDAAREAALQDALAEIKRLRG